LGWEKESVDKFTLKKDCNGIEWEEFDALLQEEEIKSIWPDVKYSVK